MLKKDIILEICNHNINSLKLGKKHKLIKEKKGLERVIIKDLEDLKTRVRKKNIYIMVEGEEIYIKYMSLPKVYGYKLDNIVENQLIHLYGRKAEEIFYSYTIYKEQENELELLVFCVNCQRLNGLKHCIKCNNVIKKVNLIQFYFLQYFKNYVLDKSYIFIFNYNENLYITAVSDDKIIANKVIRDNNENYEFVISQYDYINDKVLGLDKKINKVYSVNLNDIRFKEYLMNEKKYTYENLGEFDEEIIMETFILNRS
ncbi:hypothetical protein [Clostridium ganghwense]|uniref:Uncharacterized protein n=1 Tax=Clostridium ganghwense TaxID=312089 RepID=A0ABT4CMP3_9CLOT|nr:hypothetical protein [Clostridium ganghwense]MCY6370329.1 hypothetical protein [Clostridium ganghwense]